MNHRLRTSLAAAAVVASVSVASVASAHEGEGKERGHGKAKPCKKKGGKGYLVHGLFAGGELERVAGGDTAKPRDDRYSGTIVVEVRKGNRRGRRDLGLSSYEVTKVRVIGAGADGALPAEGTRVQLVGKQAKNCEQPEPTTPEPTTPEETTPEETTPEPSATSLRVPGSRGSDRQRGRDVSADEDQPGATTPSEDDDATDREHSGEDESGDDHSGDDLEPVEESTAVTDVTIRVVHFKVRPKAARR